MITKDLFQSKVNEMNVKLTDYFGYLGELPKYRIVWSEDQFEFRNAPSDAPINKFDVHGNKVGEQEGIQFLPKYRQWISNKWVLERCCDTVNELKNKELTSMLSYEPIFTFKDKYDNALPPDLEVATICISAIHTAIGGNIKMYKDPDISPEARALRISQIMEQMFPDETDTGDALAQQSGVAINNDSMRIREN